MAVERFGDLNYKLMSIRNLGGNDRMNEIERWFGTGGELFFGRTRDGRVVIAVTNGKHPDEGGKIVWSRGIDDGTWGSAVLTMSAFMERPNDWQAFMDHHHGRRDLLESPKEAQVANARAKRYEEAYARLLEQKIPTNNA